MHATFTGNPENPDDDQMQVCTVFGVTFFRGQPKDVSGLDPAFQRKLAHNKFFLVSDDGVPDAVSDKPRRGRPARAKADVPVVEDAPIEDNG